MLLRYSWRSRVGLVTCREPSQLWVEVLEVVVIVVLMCGPKFLD